MKARLWIYSATLSLAMALTACQTPPPAPSPTPSPTPEPTVEPSPEPTPAPDVSTLTVSRDGFSPLADAPNNTLSFDVHLVQPESVTKWTVTVSGSQGIIRTVNGDKTIPSWTWDGTTDGPKLADGKYSASLTVQRGDASETVTSAPFIVDVTRPTGTVTVDPRPFTPNAEGDPVTFSLDLKAGGADLMTWRLFVMHPDGRRFADFISENYSDNKVVWDGRDKSGNPLENGTTYRVVVQVVDRYGNTGTINSSLPITPGTVVAPISVSLDGSVISELQVYFPANSADLSKVVDAAKTKSNRAALDKLAALLKASPGTKIRVVGHANQVLWQDPVKARYEQTETLIPLSKARAEAVLAALKQRGLAGDLFEVTGVGAEGNVVPFSDSANIWKNRRVEFNIER